jgi:LmbE family N-acetylglucosaminyl deacetylase
MPERDVRRAVAGLGTILSVWAHPDDETYLAGGIMAAAVANGQRVVCVTATAGERGTDDPERWPPERLGRVRRWEALAAMAVLGVRDHRVLGWPDGGLAAMDTRAAVDALRSLVDEVRPDTILTFGPQGNTFHPDHRAVSAWTTSAWWECGSPGRLLHSALATDHLEVWGGIYEEWGVFMTDERPTGVPPDRLAFDVELDADLLDQKIAAVCAMHSQVAPALAVIGDDVFRANNVRESYVAVAPIARPAGPASP